MLADILTNGMPKSEAFLTFYENGRRDVQGRSRSPRGDFVAVRRKKKEEQKNQHFFGKKPEYGPKHFEQKQPGTGPEYILSGIKAGEVHPARR